MYKLIPLVAEAGGRAEYHTHIQKLTSELCVRETGPLISVILRERYKKESAVMTGINDARRIARGRHKI